MPLKIVDLDSNAGVSDDVLDPLRFVPMFREDVDAPAVLNEPDFDLPRQSRFAAGRREVNELCIEGIRSRRHRV